jgi:hypothetical protein
MEIHHVHDDATADARRLAYSSALTGRNLRKSLRRAGRSVDAVWAGRMVFSNLIARSYLGFTKTGTGVSASVAELQRVARNDLLCWIKLSDVPLLATMRPAATVPTELMAAVPELAGFVPEELMLACMEIAARLCGR